MAMSEESVKSPFDASASALGYAYQFRYALNRAIDELRHGCDWVVRIEAADDVELEGATLRELRQLKQVKKPAQLSDSSEDLWKTLRIWSVLIRSSGIDIDRTIFFLVTTGQVSGSAVASKFRDGLTTDEVHDADAKLIESGSKSKNETVAKAYYEYSSLDRKTRLALLRRIRVLTSQDDVMELRGKLLSDLRVGTRAEHVVDLLEQIEGWWFQACLECLAKSRGEISGAELDSVVTDARDQYRPDNLPVDFDLLQADSPELESFEERVFVRQIELASRNRSRIQAAVRDYLRASSQRSRWARKNLLVSGELENYERLLKEEWELVFADCCDELTEDSDEIAKARVARKMIGWAEQVRMPIRSFCTEPFISRGSYHMLADNLTVGWHPEYMARLLAIVDTSGGASS